MFNMTDVDTKLYVASVSFVNNTAGGEMSAFANVVYGNNNVVISSISVIDNKTNDADTSHSLFAISGKGNIKTSFNEIKGNTAFSLVDIVNGFEGTIDFKRGCITDVT